MTEPQPIDILAIGVHPDDVELSAVGTLLSHIEQGYTVGMLDLTRGELGTRGSAEIRQEEALDAARLLGAKFRTNADMADGFFQHTPDNIRKIIRVLRASRPAIVLANAPADRHPDHGRAAKLIADACYYSGLLKIDTGQEKWRPQAVYHYIQDRNLKPDFVVDIAGHFERKIECVSAFRSQFNDEADNEYKDEEKTPISGANFMKFLEAKARNLGREANLDLAEGFTVDRCPGVNNLFDLI